MRSGGVGVPSVKRDRDGVLGSSATVKRADRGYAIFYATIEARALELQVDARQLKAWVQDERRRRR